MELLDYDKYLLNNITNYNTNMKFYESINKKYNNLNNFNFNSKNDKLDKISKLNKNKSKEKNNYHFTGVFSKREREKDTSIIFSKKDNVKVSKIQKISKISLPKYKSNLSSNDIIKNTNRLKVNCKKEFKLHSNNYLPTLNDSSLIETNKILNNKVDQNQDSGFVYVKANKPKAYKLKDSSKQSTTLKFHQLKNQSPNISIIEHENIIKKSPNKEKISPNKEHKDSKILKPFLNDDKSVSKERRKTKESNLLPNISKDIYAKKSALNTSNLHSKQQHSTIDVDSNQNLDKNHKKRNTSSSFGKKIIIRSNNSHSSKEKELICFNSIDKTSFLAYNSSSGSKLVLNVKIQPNLQSLENCKSNYDNSKHYVKKKTRKLKSKSLLCCF